MIKIYEDYLDEYVIDITNKSRYDYYRYKGNDFAHDKKNDLLLYLYKDEEDGNYYEVEAIGLRPDNWKNKNVRNEYIEEYLDELDTEVSYLANDFIKNELPYYQNESYGYKKESRKRFYEGHTEDGYMGATKWVGDKSHMHLYGKDLASAIRQDLKDNGISGCTVRAGKATYTTTITVTVKGNPNDKLTYDEFLNTDWEDTAFGYNGRFWFSDGSLMYTEYLNADTEAQKELSRKIYDAMVANKTTFDINKHYIDKSYNSIFTQQFIKKLQKINDIVIEFNYDDSNGMVDYFETNFYYDIVVVFK